MAVCEIQRQQFKGLSHQERERLMLVKTRFSSDISGSHDRADTTSTLQSDAGYALLLKDRFYAALGILPGSPDYQRKLSYEPWVERAAFERLMKNAGGWEEEITLRENFHKATNVQVATSLRERYLSEKSKIKYDIKNGKLYCEFFQNEPFENVLIRGLEYRSGEGSDELLREEKEVEGFINVIQKTLCNPKTPSGTKIISLSPPGVIEGTQYTKRFVDILELKEDEMGLRHVELTRFTCGLNHDGYKKSAIKLDPDYFDGFNPNIPLDVWYLSHPIVIPPSPEQYNCVDVLYDEFFERDYEALQEEQFQEILEACMPFILYYIQQLCADKVDWGELALSFNAILARADKVLKEKEEGTYQKTVPLYPYEPLDKQVAYWGRQEVATVGGGCPGVSSGFKISYGFESLSESLLNSVSQFGLNSDEYGSLEFDCPHCNKVNRRPKGKLISSCQHCGRDVKC